MDETVLQKGLLKPELDAPRERAWKESGRGSPGLHVQHVYGSSEGRVYPSPSSGFAPTQVAHAQCNYILAHGSQSASSSLDVLCGSTREGS